MLMFWFVQYELWEVMHLCAMVLWKWHIVKHCITRYCCSTQCTRFTVRPHAQKIQVNCFLQLWIFLILRDMLNKVVLKTWLDHLGCFAAHCDHY